MAEKKTLWCCCITAQPFVWPLAAWHYSLGKTSFWSSAATLSWKTEIQLWSVVHDSLSWPEWPGPGQWPCQAWTDQRWEWESHSDRVTVRLGLRIASPAWFQVRLESLIACHWLGQWLRAWSRKVLFSSLGAVHTGNIMLLFQVAASFQNFQGFACATAFTNESSFSFSSGSSGSCSFSTQAGKLNDVLPGVTLSWSDIVRVLACERADCLKCALRSVGGEREIIHSSSLRRLLRKVCQWIASSPPKGH